MKTLIELLGVGTPLHLTMKKRGYPHKLYTIRYIDSS